MSPTPSGANYQNAIADYVSRLHNAGLYTIVELHWNAPGTHLATNQQPAPDADHSPAFWSSVADHFKSDPMMVFDLHNEPFMSNKATTGTMGSTNIATISTDPNLLARRVHDQRFPGDHHPLAISGHANPSRRGARDWR